MTKLSKRSGVRRSWLEGAHPDLKLECCSAVMIPCYCVKPHEFKIIKE